MAEPIVILVSLDEKYVPQLKVMLTSLYLNNPGERIQIYLLHRSIPETVLLSLQHALRNFDYELFPLKVEGELFRDAPVTKRYPQEMYYRLCAPAVLPKSLEKVLYLDPDLLIINSIRPLWQQDLQGRIFAAAAHTGNTELANNVNRLRLGTEHKYYNSGVLLIQLAAAREEVMLSDIFQYVKEHQTELLLPDQDILNALYGKKTLELDDYIWNYDARNFNKYFLRSSGRADIDWVMQNTAILHFCGRTKPWKPFYRHRFGVLYKHYMRLADRLLPAPDANLGKEDAPVR